MGDLELTKYLYEGRATGIPTIQRELKANGSDPARIETNDERSYFLITIPCRKEFLSEAEAADAVTRQEKDPYSARKNTKNQQTKQSTRQENGVTWQERILKISKLSRILGKKIYKSIHKSNRLKIRILIL